MPKASSILVIHPKRNGTSAVFFIEVLAVPMGGKEN
jgi:hypothetical protein